jgi:hypothetical protein
MTTSSGHLSEIDLISQLEIAHTQVKVGALYAHYRNLDLYRVVGLGFIEATQEVAVIYQQESGSLKPIQWIRPISSWLEQVNV